MFKVIVIDPQKYYKYSPRTYTFTVDSIKEGCKLICKLTGCSLSQAYTAMNGTPNQFATVIQGQLVLTTSSY